MDHVAERRARRFLALADRLLGDRLVGFHVVGSAALGGFVPSRSDLDFVAVIDAGRDDPCRRIRLLHATASLMVGAPAALRHRSVGAGSCNGVYIHADQVERPVTQITPIASHHGTRFERGRAFDVNPVVWTTLAEHGVTLRGPAASDLALDPEPHRLRQWTLDNLNGYWAAHAAALSSRRPPRLPWVSPSWIMAWTVLGPPRLHHTVATGEIISKQQAGNYARDVFGREWHPLVGEALAVATGASVPTASRTAPRLARSAEFALHVIDSANSLITRGGPATTG